MAFLKMFIPSSTYLGNRTYVTIIFQMSIAMQATVKLATNIEEK